MAISIIKLDNFRTFGANGKPAEFELAPITILTGTNSSGKSSLIKYLLLMNGNSDNYSLANLDFTKGSNNLGSYSNTLTRKGTTSKNLKTLVKVNDGENSVASNESKDPDDIPLFAWNSHKFNYYWELTYGHSGINQEMGKIKSIRALEPKKLAEIFSIEFEYDSSDRLTEFIKIFFDSEYFYNLFSNINSALKGKQFSFTTKIKSMPDIVIVDGDYYFNFEINYSKAIKSTLEKNNLPVRDVSLDFTLFFNVDSKNCQTNCIFNYGADIFKFLNELTTNGRLFEEFDSYINIIFWQIMEKSFDKTKEELMSNYNMILNTLVNETFKEFLEIYAASKIDNFIQDIIEHLSKEYNNLINHFNQIKYTSVDRGFTDRLISDKHSNPENIKLLYQVLNSNKKNLDFVNKWVSEFGIGERIKIIREEGYGYKINVLDKSGLEVSLIDLGFGFSQVLPIILQIALNGSGKHMKYWDRLLIVEEPESHLHPALQSKLADMFLDAHNKFGLHFILESHSEYMIRKFQYLIAKKEAKQDQLAIYYFGSEPTERDYIRKMEINDSGFMVDDFGEGFFDEASKLITDLWEIQRNN